MPGSGQGALATSSHVSFSHHVTIDAMGCSCILQTNPLRLLPLQLQKWLVSGVRWGRGDGAGRAELKARFRT